MVKFTKNIVLVGAVSIFVLSTVTACAFNGKVANIDNSVVSGGSVVDGASASSVSEYNQSLCGIPFFEEIETTKPECNVSGNSGSGFNRLLYADNERLIMIVAGALFEYDRKGMRMSREVDLRPINCYHSEGDEYTIVKASNDGENVYMHDVNKDDLFIYSVATDRMYKTSYSKFKKYEPEYFDKIGCNDEDIKYNHKGVMIYGRIECSDNCLGGVCYVQECEKSITPSKLTPLFLDRKYQEAGLLKKKEIHDICKMEMFIEGQIREVTDVKTLKKVEKEIKNSKKMNSRSKCGFYRPAYLTMKDGAFGAIIPADDGCNTFLMYDSEYEMKTKQYSLMGILSWTKDNYHSLHT